MKNQYFGDLSDYKKYSILRFLGDGGLLRICICWMLTEDDGGTDGRHTQYLSDGNTWRKYDPPVFDLLFENVVAREERRIEAVEESDLLTNTNFLSERLTDDLTQRQAYFAALHRLLDDVDIVFLDPDNGLETKSTLQGKRNSNKYLYWSELDELIGRDHSVLVYQHYTRTERAAFVRNMALQMLTRYTVATVFVVRTRHTAFFLIPAARHERSLRRALEKLADTWGEHIAPSAHTAHGAQSLRSASQLELL